MSEKPKLLFRSLSETKRFFAKDHRLASKRAANGSMLFGVAFSADQNAALKADSVHPRWGSNPPQREEYDSDKNYALGLRRYADRLIASNHGGKTMSQKYEN